MGRPKKVYPEPRRATVLEVEVAANGRTSARVECPFCENQMVVPVWSLAGTGKRCSCKAVLQGMHTKQVYAYPGGKKRESW